MKQKLFIKNNDILIFIFYTSIISFFILSSCKNRNYVIYYNKVNEIDSIYRIANKPEKAVKEYKKLFRNYSPKNQERIEEYETYIKLADKYHKNFGGKKSLYKLITLVAPYGDTYKNHFDLCQKYGIDSMEVSHRVANWKKNLNKQLIDSFTVAMIRDQAGRPTDRENVKKNVRKNAELFIWTFKYFGFPSLQKIGNVGNDNVFIAMPTLLTHMNESEEYYPQIKDKLLEYIKTGDCPPMYYTLMVDNPNFMNNRETVYSYNPGISKDSTQIDFNRKSIGLPSLKHAAKIRKDSKKK